MSQSIGPSDVVIIGAGIVGCATAYYLAKEGVKTTIIEPDSVATHASGFALGAINPLSGVGIPDPLGALSMESYRLHNQLATELPQETGVDTQFQLHSAITMAYSHEEQEALQTRLPWQQAQEGFQVQWKSGIDILGIEPRLAPDVLGGVVTQFVAMLSPDRFVLSLLQAAKDKGTIMRRGLVQGLRFQDNRIRAVRLENEEISCNAVVVSTGPWAGNAARWLGIDIPVEPLKGQILRLRVGDEPLHYLSWGGSYAVVKPDGLLWVGTTEERVGFDETPTYEGRQAIMASILQAIPYLKDAEVVHHTACLRPTTSDGLPILGQVPGKQGVIVATGAGRKGIHLGPIMGRITADLVTHGRTRWDIAALAPGRSISAAQLVASDSDPFRF